jgi:hypothetical protein
MKSKILSLVIMGMLVFSAGSVRSQPPPPPPGPGSESAPIDNGALILLLAVGYYGYMELKKKEATL